LLAALLATIATSHAQDPDPAKFAGVRRQMQSFVDAAEISGSVTVIGRKGGVVSLEAVGLQDLDRGAAMPQDALFRIASMTKPITAIGIMILAEEGKLAIDDPVEKHLPEFRGQMLVAERGPDTVTLKKPSRAPRVGSIPDKTCFSSCSSSDPTCRLSTNPEFARHSRPRRWKR